VRVGLEPPLRRGHLNHLEQFEGAPVRVRLRDPIDHRLRDLLADREHGIERSHRFLEDHRDERSAHLAKLAFAERKNVHVADADLAADPRGRRKQTDERAQCHALAGAGFAEQAERPASLQRKADPIHDRHVEIA
jgi:hypothetical protein